MELANEILSKLVGTPDSVWQNKKTVEKKDIELPIQHTGRLQGEIRWDRPYCRRQFVCD